MDFEKMHDEVLHAFHESCAVAARQQYRGRGFRPAADAYFEEDTREIVVRFELPGMTLDGIELLVDRRELVVRGERPFRPGRGACTSRSRPTTGTSNAASASSSMWSRKSPPPRTRRECLR